MSKNSIVAKWGILIALMIAGFFLICKALGWEDNPYLRFVNLVFVILGVNEAIKTCVIKNKETNYMTSLGIGIRTSVLALLLSIGGVLIYIYFVPEFLQTMDNSFLISGDLTIAEIAFALLIEGMALSMIAPFIIMQFYKDHNKEQVNKKETISDINLQKDMTIEQG